MLADAAAQGGRDYFLLIRGVNALGRKFRPSDWADRLMGAVYVYAHRDTDYALDISRSLCLINSNGIKGLVVDPKLEELEARLYDFLCDFAKDNKLLVERVNSNDWNRQRRRVPEKPKRAFS